MQPWSLRRRTCGNSSMIASPDAYDCFQWIASIWSNRAKCILVSCMKLISMHTSTTSHLYNCISCHEHERAIACSWHLPVIPTVSKPNTTGEVCMCGIPSLKHVLSRPGHVLTSILIVYAASRAACWKWICMAACMQVCSLPQELIDEPANCFLCGCVSLER